MALSSAFACSCFIPCCTTTLVHKPHVRVEDRTTSGRCDPIGAFIGLWLANVLFRRPCDEYKFMVLVKFCLAICVYLQGWYHNASDVMRILASVERKRMI
jgi:hypothetical protein